jgi:hypothetical protein
MAAATSKPIPRAPCATLFRPRPLVWQVMHPHAHGGALSCPTRLLSNPPHAYSQTHLKAQSAASWRPALTRRSARPWAATAHSTSRSLSRDLCATSEPAARLPQVRAKPNGWHAWRDAWAHRPDFVHGRFHECHCICPMQTRQKVPSGDLSRQVQPTRPLARARYSTTVPTGSRTSGNPQVLPPSPLLCRFIPGGSSWENS